MILSDSTTVFTNNTLEIDGGGTLRNEILVPKVYCGQEVIWS